MTHDEMIAVIKAEKEGKLIDMKLDGFWCMKPINSPFNFCFEYRIKPEPKKRLITAKELFEKGAMFISHGNNYEIIMSFDIDYNTVSVDTAEYKISTFKERNYKWTDADRKEWHSFEIEE
jgi:hypothetical protein